MKAQENITPAQAQRLRAGRRSPRSSARSGSVFRTPSLRAVLFAIVVSAFLCGPIAMGVTRVLQHFAGFDLPAWLTVEKAEYLSGGYTPSNLGDHLNLASVADGSFQKAVGVELENSAPCKANALLMNAGVQRAQIATANLPFRWPCYPTYFGSEQLYVPAYDALTYHPMAHGAWLDEGAEQLAAGLADFAARYPEKHFVVYAVPGFRTPAYSPVYDLIPKDAGYSVQDFCSALEQGIAEENDGTLPDNVQILTSSYSDADSYYQDFFRSDHHWNMLGVTKAYNNIAQAIGLPLFQNLETQAIEDYSFSGATARWGLDMVKEPVFDLADDFSDVRVVKADGSKTDGANHERFFQDQTAGRNYRFYDNYYDNIGGGAVMYGSGKADAILVMNSYGAALSRVLARQYHSTTLSSALHQDTSGGDSLAAIAGFEEADDIYFVADPYAFGSFCRRMPHFFE